MEDIRRSKRHPMQYGCVCRVVNRESRYSTSRNVGWQVLILGNRPWLDDPSRTRRNHKKRPTQAGLLVTSEVQPSTAHTIFLIFSVEGLKPTLIWLLAAGLRLS
jgi:hypothetical protein